MVEAVLALIGPAGNAVIEPAPATPDYGPMIAAMIEEATKPEAIAAVHTAIESAIHANFAKMHNNFARAHNSAADDDDIGSLMPLENAQGDPPPAGTFPASTEQLLAWKKGLTTRSPALWRRLHLLLQFYQVLDPDGAPYVQAGANLPACPARAAYRTQMKARLAAFDAFIKL